MTIKAKAFKTGYNASLTTTAIYTIGDLPAPDITPSSGDYPVPQNFRFSWVEGADCYAFQTFDGSEPETPSVPGGGGQLFVSGYRWTDPMTWKIKLRAYRDGQWSPVTYETYNLQPGLRIVQLDEVGSSFGPWSRWVVSGKWSLHNDEYVIFRPQSSTNYTLKASQEYKLGTSQKYFEWRKGAEQYIINHTTISADQNTAEIEANFRSTYNNITIRNELIESPSFNGEKISFRDPWFIDFNEPPYGMRNQGQSGAQWHDITTLPFNPNSSSAYKGVFLNQDYNIPGNPYYSVGAPQTQTIGGYNSNFLAWSGDPAQVEYQNSNVQQTGVVFKQANATVVAKYKGHLISSTSAALANSNQRKLSGNHYLVYVSNNTIWLTKHNGTTWNPEILVSSLGNTALNPSIKEYWPYVHIVWEEVENGGHWVKYRRYDESTSQFSGIVNVSTIYDVTAMEETPVVEAIGYLSTPFVVWTTDLFLLDGLMYRYDPLDQSKSPIALTIFPERLPSLSTASGENKYLVAYVNESDQIEFLKFEIQYPSRNPINKTYTIISGTETNVSNPSITVATGGKIFVAWDGIVGSTRKIFVREGNNGGGWQSAVQLTHLTHQAQSPLSGLIIQIVKSTLSGSAAHTSPARHGYLKVQIGVLLTTTVLVHILHYRQGVCNVSSRDLDNRDKRTL